MHGGLVRIIVSQVPDFKYPYNYLDVTHVLGSEGELDGLIRPNQLLKVLALVTLLSAVFRGSSHRLDFGGGRRAGARGLELPLHCRIGFGQSLSLLVSGVRWLVP